MFTANLVFVNLHFYAFLKELSPYSSARPLYRCVAISAGGTVLIEVGGKRRRGVKGWEEGRIESQGAPWLGYRIRIMLLQRMGRKGM